ncbi:MAG TPA: OB-fold domain-containing protein, partial [Microthrixaceae bacterium]|nr:OB-fold domain-containing protein [Microthrixaceae bacterium]
TKLRKHLIVRVGTEGTVTSWSWVAEPRSEQALESPHALAFIRLDGADTAMLHVIDAPGPDSVRTGGRVRIRWADEPQGLITDIACFEPVGG